MSAIVVSDIRPTSKTQRSGFVSAHNRKFRPDVEGLRAIAVALVVLCHAGVPLLSGGYVGVDVFFVLSGFLITGLLMAMRKKTGKIAPVLLDFYARRARRIAPRTSARRSRRGSGCRAR